MRYSPEQKEQTRKRIVSAARTCFKESGYSGVGIDGLAKAAGVTSGAFYVHFDSKEDAFKEAIISGMAELSSAIIHFKQEYGEKWWHEFAAFYTNQKRTCDLSESCALQSLTPEVGRANEAIRDLFETELLKITKIANDEQQEEPSQKAKDRTWVSLAMLIGGVTLARAVNDDVLSNEIAEAIKNEVVVAHKSNKKSR